MFFEKKNKEWYGNIMTGLQEVTEGFLQYISLLGLP